MEAAGGSGMTDADRAAIYRAMIAAAQEPKP